MSECLQHEYFLSEVDNEKESFQPKITFCRTEDNCNDTSHRQRINIFQKSMYSCKNRIQTYVQDYRIDIFFSYYFLKIYHFNCIKVCLHLKKKVHKQNFLFNRVCQKLSKFQKYILQCNKEKILKVTKAIKISIILVRKNLIL